MRLNEQCSFEVTPLAAALLHILPQSGVDGILCGAEELAFIRENDTKRKVIAVYGDSPKEAYVRRGLAYDRSDASLTLYPQTALRLSLLHSNVLLAKTGEHALVQVKDFFSQSNAPKNTQTSGTANGTNNDCSMTILFLTNDFRVGGLEQVVIDVSSLAQSLEHKTIIGYTGMIDDVTRKDVEKADIEHVRLPETCEGRKKFLRDRNISIVNAHYSTKLAEECQELEIPYLQTIHNMYLWLDEAGIAEWQRLDKLTTGYIAVSANAAMVADLRLGLSPEKMVIVPNGVNLPTVNQSITPEEDDDLRAELAIPQNGIVFVQVASINGVKGHLVTIEAMARALQKRNNLYCVFLGKAASPELLEQLQNKIQSYGLEKNVLIPGYRKDVHRFLNLARAIVAPSFVEGWSLAISEALQKGVPVIATDVGGAYEQLRGKENIIIPAFIDNVETLTSNDFYAALIDEQLHKSVAPSLEKALLEAATWPKRTKNTPSLYGTQRAKDAYLQHLDIMQRLIHFQKI